MSATANYSAALAAIALSLAVCPAMAAKPTSPMPAASGAPSATEHDKSAQALRNEELRKCKEMTGDEKAACQREADKVSAEKARHDAKANGAGTGK